MPTKCEECGDYSYSIYFTREWKKLCGDCYAEVREKNEKPNKGMDEELDKYPYRDSMGVWA